MSEYPGLYEDKENTRLLDKLLELGNKRSLLIAEINLMRSEDVNLKHLLDFLTLDIDCCMGVVLYLNKHKND